MTKLLGAVMLILSMAVFGAPVASALETSPVASTQDGDKGKKKHGKKKHKKGKKGKKKQAKKGKKAGKKAPKKQNKKKGKK